MKKFIQKTTAFLTSLAMTALIGVPAYASGAEDETLQDEQQIIESVLPEITDEEADAATDFLPEEQEIAISTEAEDENDTEEDGNDDTSEVPEISEKEIKDIINSEEVQDALEEVGVDAEELTEGIENGDAEFVEVTEEDLPDEIKDLNLLELYGVSVLTVAMHGGQLLTDGLFLIALAPAGLFLWIFPPVGAAYTIAGIPLGLLYTLEGAAMIIASPVAGLVMAAVIKSE